MDMETIDNLIEVLSAWGLKVVGGIAVLIIGLVAARIARRAAGRALGRSLDDSLASFLANLVYYSVLVVVLIAVLGGFGVETTSLITILGASSLAIGLALQGSLSNFASGVMLLVFRPFRVGDFIEVGELQGVVAELGVFSTAIDTLDNVRIVLPNSFVAEKPIENWSANGTRRLDLRLEIAVGSPLPEVRAAVARALDAEPRVLDEPGAVVGVDAFGDTSARLVIRPWCRHADYWDLQVELPERLKDAVEAAGASLPCPQRSLRLFAAADAA